MNQKYVSFYQGKKRLQFKVTDLQAATKLAIKMKVSFFWYGERNNDVRYSTQEQKRKNVNFW
jgi:hypothetical protein